MMNGPAAILNIEVELPIMSTDSPMLGCTEVAESSAKPAAVHTDERIREERIFPLAINSEAGSAMKNAPHC